MPTVTIQEAQNRLSDLVHALTPGDEVVITENGEPVANLARTVPTKSRRRSIAAIRCDRDNRQARLNPVN